MAKGNKVLYLGVALLLLLLAMYLFRGEITWNDPYKTYSGTLRKVEIDGVTQYLNAPFPPDKEFLMGSDILGRDIFSRLIYGIRITITIALAASVFKFILSMCALALYSLGIRQVKTVVQVAGKVFTNLPALIIAYLILSSGNILNMDIREAMIAFALVIALVEGFRLARTLLDKYDEVSSMPFIIGQKSIGKSNFSIFTQNILPHMMGTMVIYFFLETGRALLLLAQLGLLGIFAGRNKVDDTDLKMLRIATRPEYYPEWGGMLATARYSIAAGKLWMSLYPAAAFFIAILGFNLTGEGLRMEIEKKHSKIILDIKRFLRFISPTEAYKQLRSFSENRKPLAVKGAIIAVILIISTVIGAHKEIMNQDKVVENYNALMKISEQNEKLDYLKKMGQSYGFIPLFSSSIDQIFQTGYMPNGTSDISFTLSDGSDEPSVYKYPDDFDFGRIYVFKDKYEGKIATIKGLTEYGSFILDRFAVIDNSDSEDMMLNVMSDQFKNAFFLIKPKSEKEEALSISYSYEYYDYTRTLNTFTPFSIYFEDEIYEKIVNSISSDFILKNNDKYFEKRNLAFKIRSEGIDQGRVVIIHKLDLEDEKSIKEAIAMMEILARLKAESSIRREIDFILCEKEYGASQAASALGSKLTGDTVVFQSNGILSNKLKLDISQLKNNTETLYREIKRIYDIDAKYGKDVQEAFVVDTSSDLMQITGHSSASGFRFITEEGVEYNNLPMLYDFFKKFLKGE